MRDCKVRWAEASVRRYDTLAGARRLSRRCTVVAAASVRSARAASASAGCGSVRTTSASGSVEAGRGTRPLAPPTARSAKTAKTKRKTRVRVGIVRATMPIRADVAELVDAHGSGPCGGNPVEVQVLSSASRFSFDGYVCLTQAGA